MLADVSHGKVVRLSGDPQHVVSKGFVCPKGIAANQITHDPDRILHPMRKTGGGWERISWETAVSEIAARLNDIRSIHGPHSIGVFNGNPHAYSYSSRLYTMAWATSIGTRNVFGSGSQDNLACFAASRMLYGDASARPVPDVDRTSYLLIIGSNPVVSQGTLMNFADARNRLQQVRTRGGRLVVIDPRRTETAGIADEHHFIRPGTDALFLFAMLRTIFEEDLADDEFLRKHTRKADELRRAARSMEPEFVSERTGIEARTIRRIARDFATATGACAFGRPVVNRFGTLAAFLIDSVNVVTGNLDAPGGAIFPSGLIDLKSLIGSAVDKDPERQVSRIGGHRRILGQLPAGILVDEINTAGAGQIRALVVAAGNPVLSIANGRSLAEAMTRLECSVAIDVYLSETAAQCDYVLPATTFLEREDFPLLHSNLMTRPYAQWTEAVIEPQGEARPEWRIISDLSAAMRLPVLNNRVAQLASWGLRIVGKDLSPRMLFDALLRMGPRGDHFLPWSKGFNLRRLREHPHGVLLAGAIPRPQTPNNQSVRKVSLWNDRLDSEVSNLTSTSAQPEDPIFSLQLIGRRDLRSANSWLHNLPKLTRRRCTRLRMNPADAAGLNLLDGQSVVVRSRVGKLEAELAVSDEVMCGVVSLPHGWGHRYPTNRRIAVRVPGPDYNSLIDAHDMEPLAGMAFLNGYPVSVESTQDRSIVTQNVKLTRGSTTCERE